jgi:hypothetical protein
LRDVWKVLSQHQKLGGVANVQSGIRWPSRLPIDQRSFASERTGFERGYGRADLENLHQSSPPAPVFLNVQPLSRRGTAYRNDRAKSPSVFVSTIRGARESRWSCVAFLDDEGLIGSEGLLAVWPKDRSTATGKLLDFFNGSERPVPFRFTGYDLEAFLPIRIRGTVDDPQREWEALNQRRIELIDKEAGGRLTQEESELERIQKDTGRYLNIIAPLPFDWLERFEEPARRAGVRLDQDEE